MQKYRVQVVPEAEEKAKEYFAYLLFVKRSYQAYKAVKADYRETLKRLQDLAGSIRPPEEPELVERGLKKILFDKHKYFLLYEIIDGEKPIARVIDMFHESENYINRIGR